MEAALESFEYPGTLVEKVKLLAQNVTEKSEALSKVELGLAEENQSSHPSWKN